jgi:iron complex outermembrane receptor protein
MCAFLLFVWIVADPRVASAQTVTPRDGLISAAETRSAIRGSVHDSTGAPLADVSVGLTGPADRVASTGADGSFEFDNLPAGDYQIVATLSGFAPVTRTLRVVRGDTTIVAFTLSVQFLEQVRVTATKTGEHDAQATPIAMSVLPARDVERLQAHTVEDVVRQAPSVMFSQNTGFAQLTIRGIGTNAVFTGSDPSSAVYVDGVYLARPAMVLTDFLDLERLEVLRGPQGTLYGRNAVGGALNVITTTPTNDAHASVRLVAGNFDALRAEGRLSGPIVPDRLLGSVALQRGVARGFVRDVDHRDQFLGGKDVWAARGKVRIVLSGANEIVVSADATHEDPTPLTYAKVLAVKPGFEVDNPADLHQVRTSTTAESRNLQYGTAVRFVMQPTPRTTVTSLTAFRKLDYDVLVDTDITELDLTESDTHEIHHQWSEEVTITHRRPRVSWLAGVFLFGDRDWQLSSIRLGGPRLENRLNPTVKTNSRAVFGQTQLSITPRVSVTAGLRYTREHKTIHNQGQLFTLDAPFAQVADSAYAFADAMSRTAWTPKFGFELQSGEHTLAYASASRGFKSGGFNITTTEPGRGFAPEWAWTYEAGVKTAVAGGRARLNVASFYTDYSNLQVQIAVRPGVLDISNAAAATIKGVEIETVSDVGSGVRVGGYVNWLDARYDRYTAVGVGGITGDAAGHRLNNAPQWSSRAWVEWRRETRRAGALSVLSEVVWQSTSFFTPFNDRVQRQPAYALVNVHAETRPTHGPWTVGVYARNLANRDYITGTFSSPPPVIGGRPGPPRQFGVEVTLGR